MLEVWQGAGVWGGGWKYAIMVEFQRSGTYEIRDMGLVSKTKNGNFYAKIGLSD